MCYIELIIRYDVGGGTVTLSGVTSYGETLYAAATIINEDDYYADTEEVQLYIAAAVFSIAAYTATLMHAYSVTCIIRILN